ncbi:MAG TPA: right-handed parallel beta-helix repeat-containing protein [Allosphingosinicella sp.]
MNRTKFFALCVAAFAAVGFSAPATAQATRTWVSGVGDDVNPCSRTAPCKTFAGAFSKTAAGGAINCLDPGGFGAVTITKSMTISCPYTEGGALAGGNGITVNAGPEDVVVIRGLDIFGVNPPGNGIRFIAGGALHVEDSTIRRFNAANSAGISVEAAGPAKLYVSRTTISGNGSGIRLNGKVTAFIDDTHIAGNAGAALSASGDALAYVGDSSIVGNGSGVSTAGMAKVNSYGDNRLNGNGNGDRDGSFSGTTRRQ